MGRPNKYPDQFRTDALELVRTSRRAEAAPQGEHRVADRQGEIAEGGCVFRPRDDEVIRFRFVQDNHADLPITRMCDLVEVPRSSFDAWLDHTPSARELADEVLVETIRDIYRRSRNTDGVPRVYGSCTAPVMASPAHASRG